MMVRCPVKGSAVSCAQASSAQGRRLGDAAGNRNHLQYGTEFLLIQADAAGADRHIKNLAISIHGAGQNVADRPRCRLANCGVMAPMPIKATWARAASSSVSTTAGSLSNTRAAASSLTQSGASR